MTTIPTGTRAIFISFLAREGVPHDHAAWEFDHMLTNDGAPVTRGAYLIASRIGAPFTINRARRAQIWESFCNAQNHASFFKV
jgi:hypothetical protein